MLYTGIVVAVLALGVVVGVIVQRRCPDGKRLPTWADVPRGRRAGAVVLALLAIATVLSSTLTSVELRDSEKERRAYQDQQNACVEHLLGVLAKRTQVVDDNHENTTRFVEALRAATSVDGIEPQAVIEAADSYLEMQDRLDMEQVPVSDTACP